MGSPADALFPIVVVLVLIAASLWVYQDAAAHSGRGTPVRFSTGSLVLSAPAVWATGCLFLSVVFLPIYIVCRRQAG